MTIHSYLLFFLFLFSSSYSLPFYSEEDFKTLDRNQILCGGCVIAVHIMDQMIKHHNVPVEDFVNSQFCELFPSEVKFLCKTILVGVYGPAIIDGLEKGNNADDICQAIQACDRPECRLLPTNLDAEPMNPKIIEESLIMSQITSNGSTWDWITDIINRIKNKKPLIDWDADNFSTWKPLRGSNWRGKDCNDYDSNIYPGRKINPYPGNHGDFSCNGIHGTAPNGESWKNTFCANQTQLGVVVLGDSAGAKFSIPAEYFTPSQITNDTFKNLYDVLLNELDQPHRSAFTGFTEGTKEKPLHSLYKFLRKRNLCNHRDYQNIAVNGARSGAVLRNSESLVRNQTIDHPVLLVLELIGNDVCTPHHTFDRMTKPENFYIKIKELLNWLDSKLPFGSHVFILGLADGSILYEKLNNETHPLGVPFPRVYDFLNCIQVNPCWGWLNTNPTIRKKTTEIAMSLNRVYKQIMNETGGRYKNFDMLYYEYPAKEIMDYWLSIGGNPADLIEHVDGFHPGEMFHSLLAEWMWDKIQTNKPHWLGKENPYNEKIKFYFGDQGGH